eukprot:TRINITY_DN5750_c0_g2_i10.p2 TRINITY_DN5750_c0_g2~~TRINITY_DN5750_c0_g2_i10.p2  ORF type:complete len:211 (-),score=-17.83 TRINITY_DN5750_c0_g2_i10:686-1318(-)
MVHRNIPLIIYEVMHQQLNGNNNLNNNQTKNIFQDFLSISVGFQFVMFDTRFVIFKVHIQSFWIIQNYVPILVSTNIQAENANYFYLLWDGGVLNDFILGLVITLLFWGTRQHYNFNVYSPQCFNLIKSLLLQFLFNRLGLRNLQIIWKQSGLYFLEIMQIFQTHVVFTYLYNSCVTLYVILQNNIQESMVQIQMSKYYNLHFFSVVQIC